MDQELRDFFNQLHALIGFNTQADSEGALQKLEQTTVLKSMECCIKSLPPSDKKQFDSMMRQSPQLTPEVVTQFFRTKLSPDKITQCFKSATKQVVRQYMATLLTTLTEAQKAQVSAELAKLFKNSDPAILREVMQEAQLSTMAH